MRFFVDLPTCLDIFLQEKINQHHGYKRNPFVSEYVKRLAKGICQLCQEKGPFIKDGVPYLHCHHIEYLSQGGKDVIENCIALCPNCHARIHELELPDDKEKLLKIVEKRENSFSKIP